MPPFKTHVALSLPLEKKFENFWVSFNWKTKQSIYKIFESRLDGQQA